MGLWSTLLALLLGAAVVGPGTSRAATITFDVSGASLERNTWFNPEFRDGTAFSPGSSLTLETDANGDAV